MIEMFVRTKHKIDKRHEFALVVVNDDALWVSAEMFKSAPNVLCSADATCLLFFLLLCVCVCVSVVRLHL